MPSSDQQPGDESKLSATGEPAIEPEEVVEPEGFSRSTNFRRMRWMPGLKRHH